MNIIFIVQIRCNMENYRFLLISNKYVSKNNFLKLKILLGIQTCVYIFYDVILKKIQRFYYGRKIYSCYNQGRIVQL